MLRVTLLSAIEGIGYDWHYVFTTSEFLPLFVKPKISGGLCQYEDFISCSATADNNLMIQAFSPVVAKTMCLQLCVSLHTILFRDRLAF